ncbi:hypothetical protein GOBAR_AA35156 [Gossypium barbadense]|uniref:Protein SCAR n=1 Tax=Gossypium barbadense TaxID=3634 RepID=A0A2P5W363_GOSBA|nr:hypothetical protein GOBAR_AA35156 [Gossypium barbadense]
MVLVLSGEKKGSRWRNGETPDFAQASHAKLHELFLEERIENAYNDPARLVKLKRRQLNESPLDSKSGKSYMEKFLETPPAQTKAVYEISGTPPLRLTLDNSSDSGPETLDISTVSPVKFSSQGKETSSSVSTVHEIVLKPSIEGLNGEVIDRDIMKGPEPTVNFKVRIPPSLLEVTTEEEIMVNGEGIEECNIYGDHSDDMTSEADKYIDALTTMVSERDTDNDYRPKNDIGFMDIGTYQTGSHANEEKLGVQGHSSDSQSDRISFVSDDGNSSMKKGRSSSNYSDTIDSLAKDMLSDGELAVEVFSSDNCVAEIVEASRIQLPTCSEMQCHSSDQVLLPKETFSGEFCLPCLGEASYSSCLEDLNSTHILLDEVSSVANPLLEPQPEEVPSDIKTNSNLADNVGGKCLDDSSEVIFTDSSEKQVSLITLSTESQPIDELDRGDTTVFSDALPHLLNLLQVNPEERSGNDHLDEVPKTDFAGEICAENSVNQTIGSPTEEQHLCSTLADGERSSNSILSPECLDVMKPINSASEVSDATVEGDLKLEQITPMVDTSHICSFNEQKFSDILHDDPKLEADLMEIRASYSEQQQNVDELFDATEGEETREFICSANVVEEDAIPCDPLYDYTDTLNLKDHVDFDDLATEHVHPESIAVPAAAHGSADFGDGDPCQEGLESNEVVSQECLTELETQEETNQVVGTPSDIDSTSCKSVSYGNFNLEDDIHYSSLAQPTKDSLSFVDLTTTPASSEFSDKESEPKYLSNPMESREDMVSSHTHHQLEKQSSSEPSLDIHTYQHDVERLHIVEDSSKRMQSLDHIDQEQCLQTSFEPSKEVYSSEPLSDFSEQSGRQDEQESSQYDLVHPAFGLQPEATKAIMEEMPPLPPLPPMQWRIGRVQHVSTAPQRELVEHGQRSFPMMPQSGTGEETQIDLPTLEQGFEQSRNPLLPLVDGEERSGNVSDQLAADFMQPSPFSMHLATMDSNGNSQYSGICSDRAHSNPFLTLPTTSNENLEYGSLAIEGERVESSFSLPMPPTDATCGHIPVSLPEKEANCPSQFVLDTSSEGRTFQDPKQNFDQEHGNPPDVSVPIPTKKEEQVPTKVAEDLPTKVEELFPTKVDEHPQHGLEASEGEKVQISNAIVQHGLAATDGETSQLTNTTLEHDLPTSEGEAACPSNTLGLIQVSEEGNSNGNPPVKLPRPRNPLIDAVAAHDKSKMKKATERIRPPTIPKVDERDSLLEQIRTKSFNLKPAAMTRPSVQGPKTNIRVAAILEKANAIRQVFSLNAIVRGGRDAALVRGAEYMRKIMGTLHCPYEKGEVVHASNVLMSTFISCLLLCS